MFEYWFISLPTQAGKRLKGESVEDHANRELNELADRGWEALSVTRPNVIGPIGFLLRKLKTS